MPRPNRIPMSVEHRKNDFSPVVVRGNGLKSRLRGFTLVELLMVIAIIGILVGMGVVGINAGAKAIQKRAIALEVAAISQAVEAYKMKYGDYPPDGSSRAAFEAHFRKAFPNIAGSEFLTLGKVANSLSEQVLPPTALANTRLTVMDPAEAIVFCLGGFSNDPVKPFTGNGGPLSQAGSGYQYNIERNSGFFEFSQDRLTLELSGAATQSNDEITLGSGTLNDALPVYSSRGRKAPLVYFAASTYSTKAGTGRYFNYYRATEVAGVARPYKSDRINTNATGNDLDSRERRFSYMNDKSFQIISAGLDDDFGGVPDLGGSNNTPVFFRYPSGKRLDLGASPPIEAGSNYQESDGGGPSPQLDNVTNFSEGPLEDSLP